MKSLMHYLWRWGFNRDSSLDWCSVDPLGGSVGTGLIAGAVVVVVAFVTLGLGFVIWRQMKSGK